MAFRKRYAPRIPANIKNSINRSPSRVWKILFKACINLVISFKIDIADITCSASAVHSLAGICENSPYEALAYYYFSFNDQTDPGASRMLSSMIRQLCGARPDSPAWLNNLGSTFRDKGARPTLEHLEGALWKAVEGFDAVY